MATSSTTTAWAKGFSENPKGRTLRAKSIIDMLDRIGDEKVRTASEPNRGKPFVIPAVYVIKEIDAGPARGACPLRRALT
jgi:hypothetical protein